MSAAHEAMSDEELAAKEKELEPQYLALSRRRAFEGKAEVDAECRRVDQELWEVRREMIRRKRGAKR